MAKQNMPNEASRKSKAEGERWSPDSDNTGMSDRSGYSSEERSSSIRNRSMEEGVDSDMPERRRSEGGAPVGHDDSERPRRSER